MRSSRKTTLALALLGAAGLVVATATALGAVTVYNNDFSSRADYRQIENSGGGKRCDRRYREKGKSMLAAVRGGPASCAFRPPVQGDRELPNHEVRLDAKVLKRTDKKLRGGAFVELNVRVGGGSKGYSLRVFPRRKRFSLGRGPAGGGFPVTDKDRAIAGINERNRLRLIARGAEIRAFVNGERVARVTDVDPGQMPGRKMRFGVGNRKKRKGDVVATFKRVALAVPNP